MKTVIEMAREARAIGFVHDAGEVPFKWLFTRKELEVFAELVRADERKRFRIDDLEMLLKVRAEQIVSLQDEIRNLMGEE